MVFCPGMFFGRSLWGRNWRFLSRPYVCSILFNLPPPFDSNGRPTQSTTPYNLYHKFRARQPWTGLFLFTLIITLASCTRGRMHMLSRNSMDWRPSQNCGIPDWPYKGPPAIIRHYHLTSELGISTSFLIILDLGFENLATSRTRDLSITT